MKPKILFNLDNPKYVYTTSMKRALKKFSEIAEKQDRMVNRINGQVYYGRPNIAGAYYIDNTTQIMTGYYCIIINDKIGELIMIPDSVKESDKIDLRGRFKKDDTFKEDVDFNLDILSLKVKQDEDYKYEIFANKYFGSQVKLVCDCLIEPRVYGSTKFRKLLIIEGKNGVGIVSPVIS